MTKDKKQLRAAIEAHHEIRLSKQNTRSSDTLDASYVMLLEIRDLLQQLVDAETVKAGKTPEVRDPLPEAEHRGGRRFWIWPTKSKK